MAPCMRSIISLRSMKGGDKHHSLLETNLVKPKGDAHLFSLHF